MYRQVLFSFPALDASHTAVQEGANFPPRVKNLALRGFILQGATPLYDVSLGRARLLKCSPLSCRVPVISGAVVGSVYQMFGLEGAARSLAVQRGG